MIETNEVTLRQILDVASKGRDRTLAEDEDLTYWLGFEYHTVDGKRITTEQEVFIRRMLPIIIKTPEMMAAKEKWLATVGMTLDTNLYGETEPFCGRM